MRNRCRNDARADTYLSRAAKRAKFEVSCKQLLCIQQANEDHVRCEDAVYIIYLLYCLQGDRCVKGLAGWAD